MVIGASKGIGKVIASTSLGRLGSPADIARAFVFPAFDDSASVTGEVNGRQAG